MLQQDLADRVAELGGKMSRVTVAKIEKGRRGVSVDEVFLLAMALNSSPAYLVIPLDDDEPFEVTPDYVTSAKQARGWLRGLFALPRQAGRVFWTQRPDEEWEPIAQGASFALSMLDREDDVDR